MVDREKVDLTKLQTDVALLKQFNEKFVEPSLKRIDAKLDGLAYVTQEQFDEHRAEIDAKFKEVKRHGYVRNLLSAVFGAVITLLASDFIRNIINR